MEAEELLIWIDEGRKAIVLGFSVHVSLPSIRKW